KLPYFASSFIYRALLSFPTRRSSDLGIDDSCVRDGAGSTGAGGRRAGPRRGHACPRRGPRVPAGRARRAAQKLEDLVEDTHDLLDRKSTRLNSSHVAISYAVFCFKKK